nr:hypothetical protein [uncultured Campylobacter sp.]
MMAYETNRIAELEKIKEHLSFEKIGEADKSNLHPFDKENIIEMELVANLLKKTNTKSDSELGKEIINLMLFYRKAYSFLRVCNTAITYGGVDAKDEEVLKDNYNFLVKSGLENILESYFDKKSYKKLLKVIKNLKD